MILDSLRNNLIIPMQIFFYPLDPQLPYAFCASEDWMSIEFILGASRPNLRLYQLQYWNGECVLLTPSFYCLVDGARYTRALRICHIDMLPAATSFTTLDWDCSPLHYHKLVNMMEVFFGLKDSVNLTPS